ncbi:extracellular catalytic domain type 1 short-chain-length polyhydroxyalkanoate depolymerase [Actinoplanes subtropicus]|uniref:extracellular catalytic domain type 1 short-chain-length polyhydroxyalkanoate depolymerase n=1 Tax=Actinoplanes subtropicus TaxID=543632 RepID=UPI0004C2DD84|nr:PHB depolymerase family esterase [Actinoplanes subtropicus]
MTAARRLIAIALTLAAVVAACAACRTRTETGPTSVPAATGSSTRTISIGGRDRTYILYRPAGLPASRVPLVVMLHGGFGSAGQAQSYYGWNAEADANHFVVAYPDGVRAAWNAGGGCCGVPADSNIDDVAFITQVVHEVSATLPIDPNRIYATGISNGGLMAYRLACDTTLFAAIGPDSATLLGDCASPHPVSVLHIHGTADTRIPYQGGQGDGFAKINGPAVPDLVARWRTVDGCKPPATTTSGPVTTSLANCPTGRSVELITITGAGHQWPGSADKPLLERVARIDTPSAALNATDAFWHFFASHPRR